MLVEAHPQAISRHNNFDLIRLLAAYQVVAMHVSDHLLVPVPGVLSFFPGVPIFFMVSGFLVTASLARCTTLGEYFRNRALRIYPGLWAMTVVTLVLLAALGHLNAATPKLPLLFYIVGQTTFLQHVAGGLQLFPSFGVGSVNGVLWTIATELQFYVCLPLLFWLANRVSRRRVVLFGALFCLSFVLYELELPAWTAPGWDKHSMGWRLLAVLYISVPTHLWGFLLGVLFYLWLPGLYRLVQGRFLYWLAAYALFVFVVWHGFGLAGWSLEESAVGVLLQRALLAGVVFSLAFSLPGLARRLLRGNDISYGVYVYHMLVIGCLVEFGWMGRWPDAVLAIVVTALVALCSWRWIERPALRLKRRGPAHAPGALAARAAGEPPG